MASAADREKALETALAQIDRQFGKGSVMRLGSDERAPVEVIPTGSIALDVALGIGGLPRGRIVEIYGPESSGKTTLTLHAIANVQKQGGIAAFIDAEHALDPTTPRSWASTSTHFWCHSPTRVNRLWKLQTCSFALVRLIS